MRGRGGHGTLIVLALWLGAAQTRAEEPGKLAHLIPDLYGPGGLVVDSEAVLPGGQTHSAHFNSAFQTEFSQLNLALVSQIAAVPLPSPAGAYTYRFDPESGVFVRSTRSFGPVIADRAETIGKGRGSFGLDYQHFRFDTLEGADLSGLPSVFTHDSPAAGGRDDVVTTVNAVDLRVERLTAFVTYGVTSRLDVSLAIPVVHVSLDVVSDATIQRIGTASNPRIHFFRTPTGGIGDTRRFQASGSASGLGDLLLRVKANTFRWGTTSLALGADVRFPTGDEEDLVGSGAFGFRPFLALSAVQRVSPHFDLGFQWNGKTVLAGDLTVDSTGTLPHQIVSAAGVDFAASDRLTLAFDLLGRRTLDSPRLELVTFHALDNRTTFPNVAFGRGSFNTLDGAAGLKWNPVRKLLVEANVVFEIGGGGLRDRVVPLFGLQYSF